MKKLITILMACVGGILAHPATASAASCQTTDCASLGYSKSNEANCSQYVYCPFDSSYKACARYSEEYPLATCPEGGVCEGKFRLDSCKLGYTQVGNSCIGGIGTLCRIGYESGTNSAGASGCYKSVCKRTGILMIVGVKDIATLDGGGKVIVSCDTSYVPMTDSNGCITSCSGGSIIDPPLVTKCPAGTFKDTETECDTCPYGIKESPTVGCYQCCTQAQNGANGYYCMRCAITGDKI